MKNSEKWITKEIYYDGSTYQCKMTQHGVMLIVLSVYDYEIGDKEETAESIITDHKLGYEVYDENGRGETISTREKGYIGQIESDLLDLGYTVSRVVLPQEKAREIDIYLKDRTMYFKVNIDRGTAVSAEDMIRTLKYIEGNGIEGVSYVDVRVEGKAFYK